MSDAKGGAIIAAFGCKLTTSLMETVRYLLLRRRYRRAGYNHSNNKVWREPSLAGSYTTWNLRKPMKNINPTKTQAWQALEAHFAAHGKMQLKDLFAKDAQRFDKFSLTFGGDILVDYSKNLIT